jgi:hypothetical protein
MRRGSRSERFKELEGLYKKSYNREFSATEDNFEVKGF